jgi:hypothetical protein
MDQQRSMKPFVQGTTDSGQVVCESEQVMTALKLAFYLGF